MTAPVWFVIAMALCWIGVYLSILTIFNRTWRIVVAIVFLVGLVTSSTLFVLSFPG